MILHSSSQTLPYKPVLDLISVEMVGEGWEPKEVNHCINLALEEDYAYELALQWFAAPRGSVERDDARWALGDQVDDYLAIYGRLPSLQWLRGLCGEQDSAD